MIQFGVWVNHQTVLKDEGFRGRDSHGGPSGVDRVLHAVRTAQNPFAGMTRIVGVVKMVVRKILGQYLVVKSLQGGDSNWLWNRSLRRLI